MELNAKQKTAFGIGAVGKDMVYALSSSYVMYYYQDVLGLSATFVGLILMIARIFDAVNDPFMGVLVAKTRTRWGRFRPWLFSGTLLNAVVLYALFAAPAVEGTALMVYFTAAYILWGVTYTMMDIPYWSMIPAVTRTPAERESLSVIGRTCAGVGSAIVTMFTMLLVGVFGGSSERQGFKTVALLVAGCFVIAEVLCCLLFREKSRSESRVAGIREMFTALFRNDQAMVVVAAIVLINCALYLTFNFIIYFFKYDFGGEGWKTGYTLFCTVGGAMQILGMMVLYPLLRRKCSNTQVFTVSLVAALAGYGVLLALCLLGFAGNLVVLCVPGAVVFACNGMHHAGCPHPHQADAGLRCPVGARHRPCVHRHRGQGRGGYARRGSDQGDGRPRRLSGARLGLEDQVRQPHRQPAEEARHQLRLAAGALHHG